jgi:CheY-like chemotaxis protein
METMSERAPNKLVLIVDDDVDIRKTVQLLLEDEGYPVATAADGNAALELLRKGLRPGLILLDVMMPHCDGNQFRKQQLADPDLQAIPVVVLTADAHIKKHALQSQEEVVAKPLTLEALLAVVARHCGPPV